MDNRGQTSIAAAGIGAIIGVIVIIIFAAIYAGLNTSQVSSSAISLLNLIDLLLAAVLVIGIVAVLGFIRR